MSRRGWIAFGLVVGIGALGLIGFSWWKRPVPLGDSVLEIGLVTTVWNVNQNDSRFRFAVRNLSEKAIRGDVTFEIELDLSEIDIAQFKKVYTENEDVLASAIVAAKEQGLSSSKLDSLYDYATGKTNIIESKGILHMEVPKGSPKTFRIRQDQWQSLDTLESRFVDLSCSVPSDYAFSTFKVRAVEYRRR